MRGYMQHLVLTSFSTESLRTRCPAGTTVKLDCGKHRHAGTDKGEKNRRSFYFFLNLVATVKEERNCFANAAFTIFKAFFFD